MKVINPNIEVMHTGMETDFCTPEQFIEKVGRTCYKSEDKITDTSAAKFVSGLIKRGHEAMIEHWNLIFKVDDDEWYDEILSDWWSLFTLDSTRSDENLRPFLRFTRTYDEHRCPRNIISGNMRAWRDFVKAYVADLNVVPIYLYDIILEYPLFFPEFIDILRGDCPVEILTPITVNDLVGQKEHNVHHDVTVKFICDRAVSHEIVRHRTSSFAQESTRYCNYSGDKYGNEITVIAPSWCDDDGTEYANWAIGCRACEASYFNLINDGCTPQEARSVLPNSLKTELIMTTNLQSWKHFFGLRCAPDAHPDIQVVAKMAQNIFGKLDIPGFRKEI